MNCYRKGDVFNIDIAATEISDMSHNVLLHKIADIIIENNITSQQSCNITMTFMPNYKDYTIKKHTGLEDVDELSSLIKSTIKNDTKINRRLFIYPKGRSEITYYLQLMICYFLNFDCIYFKLPCDYVFEESDFTRLQYTPVNEKIYIIFDVYDATAQKNISYDSLNNIINILQPIDFNFYSCEEIDDDALQNMKQFLLLKRIL